MTNKILFIIIPLLCFSKQSSTPELAYPIEVQKLMAAYPNHVKGYQDGYLIFHDQTKILFDDGLVKSHTELLDNPDIQDMFAYPYAKGPMASIPARLQDPGRIRHEEFFKKIYGSTPEEVEQHLTEIVWCPQTVNQTLRVTTLYDVDKKLLQISEQLDKHPEWAACLRAGAYRWRVIAGTERLSAHSFGIAIDLPASACADYWLRDYNTADELVPITYKNRFPLEIVYIFEEHGFIWGGKWYHYDTMHFEYRPELLMD